MKYIQLPEVVFKTNLNALQLLIYADVYTMRCQKMQYFRSNKQIATLFNRDIRNVQRAIQSMVNNGLLEVGEMKGMRTLATKTPPVAKVSRGGGESVAKGVAKMSPTRDKNATQVEKVSKSLSTSSVENTFVGDDVIYPFEEPEFMEAWIAWKEYKRIEHNFHFKSKQVEQLALVHLKNNTQDANHARQAIGQAMANGWKSIQPSQVRYGNRGTIAPNSAEGDAEAIAHRDF